MQILIAFQDLPHLENALQVENVLQFAAQFKYGIDKPPTILVNRKSGADSIPPEVDTILTEACARAPLPSFHLKICTGNPVKNILHETKFGGHDLVILSDQPNQRLKRYFRTTRTGRIAERAHCPVIVVKDQTHPIQNILMCDSGSPESPLLSSFTTQIVDMLSGEQDITILHVMSQISAGPGVRGEDLRANADELIETNTPEGDLLEQGLHSLDKSGMDPVPKVRHGLVVDEILAETRSGDYDLTIIGAHNQKWQQFLLDNLSQQIVEEIDRPVLIVK